MVARYIADLVEEVLCVEMKELALNPSSCESWRPPACGVIKVNSDGAFNPRDYSRASGVVLRDHDSSVLAAEA